MEPTREQIHIWEHAALLYHSFEWQSSYEGFINLARTMKTEQDHIKCLLNAGMIQARLGDYKEAAETFQKALGIDFKFPLAPFLLAIVEWELGNAIKTEACFRVCLEMANRTDVDYTSLGLDFVLEIEAVRRNLRSTRYPKGQRIMIAVPAQSIFEAPSRTNSTATTPTFTEELKPLEPPRLRNAMPLAAINENERGRSNSSSTQATVRDVPLQPIMNGTNPSKKTMAEPTNHRQSIFGRSTRRPWQQSTPNPPRVNPYGNTWRQRPRTPFVARDARGEYESVQELTRFIKRHANSEAPKAPRDELAELESTRELAKFIKEEGKEKPDVSPISEKSNPFMDEAEKPTSSIDRPITAIHTTHQQRPQPVTSSIYSTSLIEQPPTQPSIPPTPTTLAPTPSPTTPITHIKAPSLEILLPTIYKPPAKRIKPTTTIITPRPSTPVPSLRNRNLNDLCYSPAVTVDNHDPTESAYHFTHTAASETSSLFAGSITSTVRKGRARDAALRMLTGRARERIERRKRDLVRVMGEVVNDEEDEGVKERARKTVSSGWFFRMNENKEPERE